MILFMHFALPSLLSFVLMASSFQSTPSSTKRIDYPQESFSIAVPTTWSEIESSVLDAMTATIRKAAPNAPEIKIRHGFKASTTSIPGYPWVAIILTDKRVDETMFEKMDWANRTVDELTKKWESSGGTLQKAQMNGMSYEKS